MLEHGYIQIYTGDGKGKTTASLGLALRALGHGWKVLIIQFTKGDSATSYGEIVSSSKFLLIAIARFIVSMSRFSFLASINLISARITADIFAI